MNYARVRKKLLEKQSELKKLDGKQRAIAEAMIIKQAEDEQEDFGTADLEEEKPKGKKHGPKSRG
jgi:hypothetical protein